KRSSQCAASFSGTAQARATRRQVSSIVLSIGSPAIGPLAGARSRYFMSQICVEIEATVGIGFPQNSSRRLCHNAPLFCISSYMAPLLGLHARVVDCAHDCRRWLALRRGLLCLDAGAGGAAAALADDQQSARQRTD